MFTYNGCSYDDRTDFAALLELWMKTGGAPDLPDSLELAPALATLDRAAAGTPEHQALASAALDRMERGSVEDVETLAGVSVVLAPRAIDRLLGFAPEKWCAYGGWLNLLEQLSRVAPDHPRFVPLLRNRAERSREIDRYVVPLARHDAAWLAANLERLPRCTRVAELCIALVVVPSAELEPLALAIARVYGKWAGELRFRIDRLGPSEHARRDRLLALGLFDVDVDAPTLLDVPFTR